MQLANTSTLQAEEQQTSGPEIASPSAILMEAAGGNVIWEKDADTRRAPASVTKVMTLLLIFDALEEGKIALEDDVQTSEYAASMGGSNALPWQVRMMLALLLPNISVAARKHLWSR